MPNEDTFDAITRQQCSHCKGAHGSEVHHNLNDAHREAKIAAFDERDDARIFARHAWLEAARMLLRPGGWRSRDVYAFNARFAG